MLSSGVMTAAAEVCEGQLARLGLGQAEVLRQCCARHLGRRCVSPLRLTIEGLRKIVG